MAHRIFFFVVVLLGFGVLMLITLAYQGILPSTLQYVMPDAQALFGINTVRPYLEKFEGGWRIDFVPDLGGDVTTCTDMNGTVFIHDGKLTGTMVIPGDVVSVTASVVADGTVVGMFGHGSTNTGDFSGALHNMAGQGVWKSNVLDCSGTVQFSKTDSVIDPTSGSVLAVGGNAGLVRASESLPLTVGTKLYAGDIVEVRSGTVDLSIGLAINPTPITLQGGSSYVVPPVQ